MLYYYITTVCFDLFLATPVWPTALYHYILKYMYVIYNPFSIPFDLSTTLSSVNYVSNCLSLSLSLNIRLCVFVLSFFFNFNRISYTYFSWFFEPYQNTNLLCLYYVWLLAAFLEPTPLTRVLFTYLYYTHSAYTHPNLTYT